MRRFIRYLYEYEQEKKMRNVGFVKIEQDMEQCVIHVHGKGFRMEENAQEREQKRMEREEEHYRKLDELLCQKGRRKGRRRR